MRIFIPTLLHANGVHCGAFSTCSDTQMPKQHLYRPVRAPAKTQPLLKINGTQDLPSKGEHFPLSCCELILKEEAEVTVFLHIVS